MSVLACSVHSIFLATKRAGHAPEVIQGQAELPKYFCHGNALAAILVEPVLSFSNRQALFFGLRLVVDRRRGENAADRIEKHELENANSGANLMRPQLFDQFMGVLFFSVGIHGVQNLVLNSYATIGCLAEDRTCILSFRW